MEVGRPFTPETLAERWGISARQVRTLCKDGNLAAFKVGKKAYRITPEAVAIFEGKEQCDYVVDKTGFGMPSLRLEKTSRPSVSEQKIETKPSEPSPTKSESQRVIRWPK